jgi:hypothetical protein
MSKTDSATKSELTQEAVYAANQAWGFNCGPGALCAVLDVSPDQLRPNLLDFEQKRYTNPTLMADILRGLAVPFRRVWEYRENAERFAPIYPRFGLVRIQWGGPWIKVGVPVRARYRHTHWIAVRPCADTACLSPGAAVRDVFDVNCMQVGGWVPWGTWTSRVVPWLLRECEPKSDGKWWPTHCWEVDARR